MRDIQAYLEDPYVLRVLLDLISRFTDGVLAKAQRNTSKGQTRSRVPSLPSATAKDAFSDASSETQR